MGRFVKGEVVVMPFPFSDLSRAKRRPHWSWPNLRERTASCVRSPASRSEIEMQFPSPRLISRSAGFVRRVMFVPIVCSRPIAD